MCCFSTSSSGTQWNYITVVSGDSDTQYCILHTPSGIRWITFSVTDLPEWFQRRNLTVGQTTIISFGFHAIISIINKEIQKLPHLHFYFLICTRKRNYNSCVRTMRKMALVHSLLTYSMWIRASLLLLFAFLGEKTKQLCNCILVYQVL